MPQDNILNTKETHAHKTTLIDDSSSPAAISAITDSCRKIQVFQPSVHAIFTPKVLKLRLPDTVTYTAGNNNFNKSF